MESHGNKSTNAIGFCLLPSELIQNILLCLALPEIMSVKSLNKSLSFLISDQDFVRQYNSHSATSAAWLFVYKKRWHRDAILHGFTDQSNRWFNIGIATLIKPVICPDDDIYFLAASGNFFLFVSNVTKQVFSVNLVTKSVKKIPASPLGPRGTSSWRRPGMKLVTGSSGHFRFMFAELVDNHPVVFAYSSETDTWQSMRGREVSAPGESTRFNSREGDYVFLNVVNNRHESVMIAVGSNLDAPPIIIRQILEVNANESMITELRVYGGEYLLVIKGNGSDDVNRGVKVLKSIELLGLGSNGRNWECISRIPSTIMDLIKKPYKVMMGCLDGRDGTIRAVLFSNFEGSSDIIWMSYDMKRTNWTWVSLPDSKMKGLNMAGLAFSSGLTLS